MVDSLSLEVFKKHGDVALMGIAENSHKHGLVFGLDGLSGLSIHNDSVSLWTPHLTTRGLCFLTWKQKYMCVCICADVVSVCLYTHHVLSTFYRVSGAK